MVGERSGKFALLRQPKRGNPGFFATRRADTSTVAMGALLLVRIESDVRAGPEASWALTAAAAF